MAVWAAMAARTRVLTRMRSLLDWLPNSVMARSWASEPGSMGPPTSGTHSCTPKCPKTGKASENWLP
jgi:hypothetical protein